ncbi:PAQR family membrane homeostasis protein TrhA [Intrasporangium sp.]|uniref:PAQR family membrane homeostasis protein TrhA n=1 Tax=Intrasporangium sp. TaxID=1925024 RepID=UPI002939DAD5|nr:hemolysin III family protein [Intrasporangium sp.]MDV3220335.1 hemolysin III family protein [Intrasporangium sp.]
MAEHPDRAAGAMADLVAAVKPRLRGWLHLAMFPVALVGGIVLVLISDPGAVRTAAAVFTASATLLFGVSAIYHRGTWGPRMSGVLKRFDHSNIYLIIAGTYTPFAVTLLPGEQARILLTVIWGAAIAGVVFRIAWTNAPRWLYTALYIALGWAAVFYVVPFWRSGGPLVGSLIALGGLLYTAGGIVYGAQRPNPSPRWFGFHEVFHAFTLGGFTAHFAAVTLAIVATPAIS